MSDFLDSFLQQVTQSVSDSKINPATLPYNPNPATIPGAVPNDMFRFNQNMGGLVQQGMTPGPQAVPGMMGQAVQSPAAQLAATIGTAPTPPTPALIPGSVAPTISAAPKVASAAVGAVDNVALSSADDVVATGMANKIKTAIPSLAGASLSKGSMLKGGAAAIGGLMASGWLDNRNFGGENSELDQAITGGAMGAGAGAAVALALGGPVGWAALGGAALFAAGNMLFADNSTTEEKMDQAIGQANSTIDELIGNPMFGIDPDTASQIKLQVAATTEFYKNQKDEAGLNQYLASLSQTVPSFLMEASSRNTAQQQKMQMQAAFGPVYSRMVDRSANAAQQAFDIQMQAAGAVRDPQIRGSMETQAAQQYSAQMDTMAAYAQQIAAPQTMKPAEQGVVDQTQLFMQQAMGG